MDSTTSEGMDPRVLAKKICRSIKRREGILIVAPLYMKLVIVLQYIFPSIVAKMMIRKAQKARSG